MKRALDCACVLIVAFWCGAIALAGDSALDLVRGVRAPAQAVVAVSDLRELRRAPAGRSATAMMLDSGWLDRTRLAWTELARAGGVDATEAVDAMLGHRVVLVLGEQDGDARPWALVSEIDTAVARRLRRALRPAPRGVVHGRPVFALEQGRFELVVEKAAAETTRVILSPGGGGSMLDALLKKHVADGALPPGSAGALAQEMATLEGAPVAAGVRLGEATFIATAVATGAQLQIATVSSPGVLWSPSDCCDVVGLWPRDVRDAAPEAALLTVFGVRGEKLAGAAMPTLLPSLTSAAGLLGAEIDDFVRALDRRSGFTVTERDGSLVVEMVASLRGERATAITDAAMERVAAFETGAEADAGFGGEFPSAVRSLSYGSAGGALGEEPTLSWVYAKGVGGTWWTARFGDAPASPEVAAWGVPLVDPALADRPLVAFGRARPARLAELFDESASPAFAWIESIEWEARPGTGALNGRVSARVTVRFAPASGG